MFRQLAFASRARAGLRASEISALIGTSREHNARDDVTGVLLYSGESFVSIIEGRDAAISGLWRRLLLDDRQRGIASLFDRTVEARAFSGWRAGYVSEQQLAPELSRWRALCAALPAAEVAQIVALCAGAQTF